MSKTLKTTFRSYSTIEKAVADCRELAALANSMSFSVVDFITGPLKQRFRGRLSIEILADDDLLEGPAEVAISKNKSDLTLRVKKCIWIAASEGDAEARRILAHEIGHIWLHQDERFRFSEVATDEHNFIPNEELVEWQAHIFADNFLMPILSISTFNKLSELIDYCELFHPIPDDVVQRQFLIANDKKDTTLNLCMMVAFARNAAESTCSHCSHTRNATIVVTLAINLLFLHFSTFLAEDFH